MTPEPTLGPWAAPSWNRLCVECGFDLRHVSDRSRCSECGVAIDPRSIVIPIYGRDTWLLTAVATIFALLFLAIICTLLRWAGVPTVTVTAVAVAGASVVLASRALIAWRRIAAPHRGVLVFGPGGVRERTLGTWTSEMPYAELDGIECGRRRRNGRRTLRVHMSVGAISLHWGRGLVTLTDDEAHALLEEVRQRIELARAAR